MIVQAASDCIIDGFIFTGSRTITAGLRRRIPGVYTTSIGDVLASTAGGRGGGVFSNGLEHCCLFYSVLFLFCYCLCLVDYIVLYLVFVIDVDRYQYCCCK